MGRIITILISMLFLPSQALAVLPPYPPTITQIANAEVWVKDGWFYTIVELNKLTGGTEKWCKFIPLTYINAMPDTRQKLSVVETPAGGQVQIDECNGIRKPPEWVVAPNPSATDIPPTRPLKNASAVTFGRILVGASCEPTVPSPAWQALKGGQEYHYAVNAAGQRGITVCVKK